MHVERRIKTLWISDFYWAKTLPIGYNSTKSWVFWPSIFVCSFLKKVYFLRELVQRSELSSNIKTTRWNWTILSALLEKNWFMDALWNLKCTQEATVALEYASNKLLSCPSTFPRASLHTWNLFFLLLVFRSFQNWNEKFGWVSEPTGQGNPLSK